MATSNNGNGKVKATLSDLADLPVVETQLQNEIDRNTELQYENTTLLDQLKDLHSRGLSSADLTPSIEAEITPSKYADYYNRFITPILPVGTWDKKGTLIMCILSDRSGSIYQASGFTQEMIQDPATAIKSLKRVAFLTATNGKIGFSLETGIIATPHVMIQLQGFIGKLAKSVKNKIFIDLLPFFSDYEIESIALATMINEGTSPLKAIETLESAITGYYQDFTDKNKAIAPTKETKKMKDATIDV